MGWDKSIVSRYYLKQIPAWSLALFPIAIYAGFVIIFFLSGADLALGRKGLMPLPPTVGAIMLLSPLVGFVIIKELLGRPRGARILSMLYLNGRVISLGDRRWAITDKTKTWSSAFMAVDAYDQ